MSAPSDTKLHRDEVTEEMVSKTELKRRTKQRAAEARRVVVAASEQQTQPQPGANQNHKQQKEDEAQLDPRKYYENRSAQIASLRASKSPNPYPHKFHVSTSLSAFIETHKNLKPGENLKVQLAKERESAQQPDKEKKGFVSIAGRIVNIRSAGAHLRFYDCRAEGVTLQIVAQDNETLDPIDHTIFKRGDWIGVDGYPGRTKPKSNPDGEISIFAQRMLLLSPCLHILPVSAGFTAQEARYRNRPLDMIVHEDTRRIFVVRSKAISYLRQFLLDRDFLEVETPILNKIPGGALAKPFKTYHNDLKRELFMRVAPELYLKMLVVGGLPRVFEIGKQFRNEDIDLTHSPEFTSCEFYQSFADVHDLMETTEELLSGMVKHLKEKEGIFPDQEGLKTLLDKDKEKGIIIDWKRPWKRIEMIPELERITELPFPQDLESPETMAHLRTLLAKYHLKCDVPTAGKMIDKLVGELIEPECVNPTFITRHPQLMSPLAKPDRDDPRFCERFELFCAGKELCNAYTELNDPVIQQRLFEDQAKDREKGDDEAAIIDKDFINALEYGLPPTAGWGIGLDRLVMFLTNKYNIKEVLTFPMLKDEQGQETTEPEDPLVDNKLRTALFNIFTKVVQDLEKPRLQNV